MRRSRWTRLVAAWLACWLPLVLVDGGWFHACPMHDGMHGAAAVAMMQAPASSGSHDMAGMAGPGEYAGVEHGGGAHAGGTHAGDAPHSGRHAAAHVCTCVGACCAALAVLPSEPASVTVAVRERAAIVFTGRPEHEYVAAWVDFVLPFATAPPSQG